MWEQLTTFWSLDRAGKHYSLKEQPLNMPLGSQNPYAKRAYWQAMAANCNHGITRTVVLTHFHSAIFFSKQKHPLKKSSSAPAADPGGFFGFNPLPPCKMGVFRLKVDVFLLRFSELYQGEIHLNQPF